VVAVHPPPPRRRRAFAPPPPPWRLSAAWRPKEGGSAAREALRLSSVAVLRENDDETSAAAAAAADIRANDPTPRAPSPWANSVVAAAVTAPSPEGDVTVTLDGRKIVMPIRPSTPTGVASAFARPEWLLYQEGFARLNYLVVVR